MIGGVVRRIKANMDAHVNDVYNQELMNNMRDVYSQLATPEQLAEFVGRGRQMQRQDMYDSPIGPQPATRGDVLETIAKENAQQQAQKESARRAATTNQAVADSQTKSPGDTTGSAVTAAATETTATGNETLYDWMTSKMNLTPEGRARADYSGGIWEGTKNTAKWFTTGSGMDVTKKVGLGVAGYAAGNVALRGLSGGGVTSNNQGQRDIAGIPFV